MYKFEVGFCRMAADDGERRIDGLGFSGVVGLL